jgi:hypothetical protein
MATKTKLSPAQVRTLKEVINLRDKGFRKWTCVADYKPALALLALGYVKKDETWSDEYRMTLEPTDEGREAAKAYKFFL